MTAITIRQTVLADRDAVVILFDGYSQFDDSPLRLVNHLSLQRSVNRMQVAMLMGDIPSATVSVSASALDWPQRVLCPKPLPGRRIGRPVRLDRPWRAGL